MTAIAPTIAKLRTTASVIVIGGLVTFGGMSTSGATVNHAQSTTPRLSAFPTLSQITAQIATAEKTTQPPKSVHPSLSTLAAYGDFGFFDAGSCAAPGTNSASVNVSACTFGDKSSPETIVLTGDSRAQMWLDAFVTVATGAHFKLILLAKSGCPSPFATYRVNNNGTFSNSAWTACTKWHLFVKQTIDKMKPQVVVMSSESDLALANPLHYAQAAEIQRDTSAFIKSIPSSTKTVVLGGFPEPGSASSPTLCLSKGPRSLLTCSFTPSRDVDINNQAVESAAKAGGAGFIDQTPWLCGSKCPAIIDGIIPYTIDGYHIDNTYTTHLTGVLWAALNSYLGRRPS